MTRVIRRRIAGLVILALCGVPIATAQESEHPATIKLDGAAPLSLVGQARRLHLLGAFEFYTIAVYSKGPGLDVAQLSSPDTAKALHIQVTYEDDLRRRVPVDWRRELVPALELAAMEHLRRSFAALRNGDVVSVEYVPDEGTIVRVNKAVAVSRAQHDLMLTFLDHWLGQRPVSEDIKRMLLGA